MSRYKRVAGFVAACLLGVAGGGFAGYIIGQIIYTAIPALLGPLVAAIPSVIFIAAILILIAKPKTLS